MRYNNQTSTRKMEHLLLCAEKQVEAKNKRAGFEDITIVHKALPEINMQDIDLSYEFL
ncbi:MAG: type 2 isopentenyl-diphosphate Delta-isomerase, partial [Methanosarcinaceae archaeon]|nr:type 2 isopentenyl-diphosphate Delta-isomerase [Methanosarcinaceae archaeon]